MLLNCWKFHNRNFQTSGYVYHDTNGRNLGPVWKTQSFLLSEICTVILWQDWCGNGNSRKFCWSTVGKNPDWECFFVHRLKGLFMSVCVDDINLAGKKQNIDSMWKVVMKQVNLKEPTSFLDHVKLGCAQRECKTSKDIVDSDRTIFESRISAGATEKLPSSEKLNISSWSDDMEGHAEKCVERYCEMANKNNSALPQGFNSMPWWPSKQRRGIEFRRKNCQKFALESSSNDNIWLALVEQTLYGR